MVLVSLTLHHVNGLMLQEYWAWVMFLQPFLGSRRDVLMNLGLVAEDCDVRCNHANKLLGIWRQVLFVIKHDPSFIYKKYHLDATVMELAIEVLKGTFLLMKGNPALF